MHSHTRDRVFMGSSERANLSVKDGADQEHLQSISAIPGHHPDISGTLDEITSGAVAMSFIMNMLSFFQAR